MNPMRRPRTVTLIVTGGLISAAAMTLSSGAATAANASAAGSAAPAWPAQIARPAAAHCQPGETPLLPTSGWTDGLGVSHFSYKAQPGMVVNVAPKGLTADKVTSAVLSDLGLPSHLAPNSAAAKSVITQVVNLSQKPSVRVLCRGTTPAAPAISRTSGKASATTAPSSTSTATYTHHFSNNWAGYAVTAGEYGNIINWVAGSWNVNQSHTSTAYAPSAEATWIGMGGGIGETSSTWGLAQEGTSMMTNEGYRDWYEILGNNGTCGTSCNPVYESNVGQGDLIVGEVYWASTSQACFVFSDETNPGDSFDTCSGVPTGGIYDHTSAEWINESLVTQGYYKYYDDPGTTNWASQQFGSAFGGGGTTSSPFAYPYESEVLLVPGTPYADDSWPSPACSSVGVESFAQNPVNHGTWGSSDIATCPTGLKSGEDGN